MNTEHTNYCRQVIKQWRELCDTPKSRERDLLLQLSKLAEMANKFILPDGGRLIEDFELRGLDENEPLSLPYELIACEYAFGAHMVFQPGESDFIFDKYIIFACDHGDFIRFWSVGRNHYTGIWAATPMTLMSKTNYLLRNGKDVSIIFNNSHHVGDRAAYDARTLLHFLNALQCSNVHIERSEPRKAGKKIKTALPFDAYHVLMIDVGRSAGGLGVSAYVGHRSPREHMRRGHIRRLADGRRIWVNATVVAAGRGAGVVTKDYALRLAA